MAGFVKDLFSVLKSRVTVIGCGIVTSILTARYIGPAGNGIIATLIVYPDLFMTIGSLGIRQSTTYFVGQQKYTDKQIFSSVLYIWLFTSIFCMLVCFSLLKFFTRGDYSNWLIFMAIIPIPFSLFNTYSSGIFLGKGNIKEFNKVNWIPYVIRLITTICLVVLIPWNVQGAMTGIIAGAFCLFFMVYRKVSKMVSISIVYNKEIIQGLLKLGIVYAVSYLIISLNYKVDVMLLERFSSDYQVGIYTKGVSIVEYLWEIPTLMSTVIFSRSATSKDPLDFSHKVCRLLRLCSVVILTLSVIFFFLSSFIMTTMYGERFLPSAMVQKLLIPGILLLTIFKVLNMDLAGKGKPWIAIKAMLPSLVLNIVLNYLVDAKYGANGAAIASTVSYSVSALLFIHFYSKAVQIPIKQILKFSSADFEAITGVVKKMQKKYIAA